MRLRCARCHEEAAEAELVACPGCATRLHADCRAEAPGCPTLGCVHAARRLMAQPWEPPPSPMSCRTCVLWMLGAFAALVVLWVVDGVIHVAEVAIRNDSGRVLRNVRVDGYQYEASPQVRPAEVAELQPGASLVLRGGWSGYELDLRQVTVDGVALLSSRTDVFYWSRFATGPRGHSLLAIDQELRLRTIVLSRSGRQLPCLCPDGNASRKGSPHCPISIHHQYDHHPERSANAASGR